MSDAIPSSQSPSIDRFVDCRVLVVGDVMLDRFVYGSVKRVSPEAPIPVLLYEREVVMMGGAANVACNLVALGGQTSIVGVIGTDESGRSLRNLMLGRRGLKSHLVEMPGIQTIEKTRYVTDQQQMLRVDRETPAVIAAPQMFQTVAELIPVSDILVLSDYAKGLLSPELLGLLIAEARKHGVPVIVDPKARDLSRYNGATLLTPNHEEASATTGIHGDDDDSVSAAGRAILEIIPDSSHVIITRGERGMTLVSRDRPPVHLPALAKEVFDVSGAGDTVIATMALSIGSGFDLEDAARLANKAGGIVVGKRGTATVTRAELHHALADEKVATSEMKIVDLESAQGIVAAWRERGLIVGFTNGCFDLIHPGHVSLLAQSRAACDRLVVGLNTDASIKRLKGPSRPVQDEVSRAIVLASLSMTDLIIPFGEDTPLGLIQALRPDVLVKGKDYTVDKVVGADLVQSYGGRVLLADLMPGQSTTRTISSIRIPAK